MSNPSPQPYQMAVVYDIRSWVEDCAEELHAHTVPKCFKFECNDAGKAEMYYRNWSHEEWQGPVIIPKVNLYHYKLTAKTEYIKLQPSVRKNYSYINIQKLK